MTIDNIIKQISPVDDKSYDDARHIWDTIAKPLNGLGYLEDMICDIAAIERTSNIDIYKKCVIIFCADNGIVSTGKVSQSTHEVTTSIAASLVHGGASICKMARYAHADIFPINIGMIDDIDGLDDRCVMRGTYDMSSLPAMSRDDCLSAIQIGIDIVKERYNDGYRLLALGEAGIGNTSTSAAIASILLDKPIEIMTGRGAGLSDKRLIDKISMIKKAIEINNPNKNDPIDILSKVGGLDIAGMVGAYIGGALVHIPIIADGVIACTAAKLADTLCPDINQYILLSHLSSEPAASMLADALNKKPIIHANMHLGEGTGAVALMPLLDMAYAVYTDAARFDDIGVEAYKPL